MAEKTEEKIHETEIQEPEIKTGESAVSGNSPAEKVDRAELNNAVVEALKSVYDPEIPVNIYELGLVYSVNIDEAGNVEIEMTLTSPACPVAGTLPPEVEGRVRSIPGVKDCRVKIVWEPTWGMHLMSEEAKLQLNLF